MLNPPFNIRERLAAADRYYQMQEGLRLVCRAVPWICGFFLGALVLDLVFRLGPAIRAALLGLGIVAQLGVFGVAGWMALVRSSTPERIARILESRDPHLGSALINLLQLKDDLDRRPQPELTRTLAVKALERYQEGLRLTDLQVVARTPEVKTEGRRALFLFAGVIFLLALSFPVSRMLLPRLFDPFGGHPPFSLVQLTITDPANDSLKVIYGHDVTIKVASTGHTPSELYLSSFDPASPGTVTTVLMFDKGKGQFLQQIRGVTSELIVYAHSKDEASTSPRRKIGLVLTPEIQKAFITVQPPAYTGLAGKEEPWLFKNIQVLKGSVVGFRLESNRPLAGGSVQFSGSGPETTAPLQPGPEKTVSGAWTATESGTLKFSVKDVTGLPSEKNPSASLTVVHDLPPEVSIDEPSRDSFVSESFTVPVKISASDDYGVKTLRLHRALNEVYSRPLIFTPEKPQRRTEGVTSFNIRELGLKSGDRITFYAEAFDNSPEPHMARSQAITLTVISDDEYNNYLRQQSDLTHLEQKFSKLTNSLKDLADRQREIAEKLKRAQEALAANPPGAGREAAKKAVSDAQGAQERMNQEMTDLAKAMEEFVRKDPLYDMEAEFQKVLREQAAKLRQTAVESRDALASTSEAFQRDGNAASALAEMRKSAERQAEQLDERRKETDSKVNEVIRDLLPVDNLTKDFNYFQYLYGLQKQIADQSKAYADRESQTKEDKMALDDLAAEQKKIQMEISMLEQRLREHAAAAARDFPKAARSGRDMASRMELARLGPLAGRSAQSMAAGNGAASAALAEELRQEMEKFFSDCNGGMACLNEDIDNYLQLKRGMKPGSTFKQMAMSRRFGSGSGKGTSGMAGQGAGAGDGYSIAETGFGVLGQEGDVGGGDSAGNGERSKAGASPEKINGVDMDKTHAADGVQSNRKESEAVNGEVSIEKYREVVDAYFEKVTK